MSKKTLKFNNIGINKKEFHKSKQQIDLNLVDINKIVISDKFDHTDKGFKYSIGYKDDNIIKPLCVILHQMNGYIKYFENRGKKIVFMIEDGSVLIKYNEFHKSIQFHSTPVYDKKHINLG